MPFAIMRMSKLKDWGSIGASASHTYRTRPTHNADPSRTRLNATLIGTKGEVVGDMRKRLAAVTDKPRANAVLGLELMLTASPEWFKGKSTDDLRAWARDNMRWMRDTFGAENVAHAVMHRDETSPHIVAYIVPEKDGRLNARGIVGTPDLLRDLQTGYAAAMDRHGLERGISGSQAKHTTVRDWYARLNGAAQDAEQRVAKVEAPEPPPHVPVWKGQEARGQAVEAWKGKERGKRRQVVREAAKAALAASTAQEEVQHLKAENGRLVGQLVELRGRLSDAYAALDLSKADLAALRRSDTTLVAQRLGHMGEVRPKENAIDLVMRVGELDYGQAVAWLHAEFGPVMTGALVKTAVEQAQPERPWTKAENVIKAAVLRQADALGCDRFRVSVVPEEEGAKPYLPGKLRSGEERFYSREELVNLIPWLRVENNQGKHIFITPMDDAAFYILLDDARVSATELKRRGFQPCLVQRTSWEKEQLVFKVPKTLDRASVLAVFNEMNQQMGDPEMTGLRHPFRLAGFRNMKAKHQRDGQQPFVVIGEAVNRFCERCTALVRDVMRRSPVEAQPEVPGLR